MVPSQVGDKREDGDLDQFHTTGITFNWNKVRRTKMNRNQQVNGKNSSNKIKRSNENGSNATAKKVGCPKDKNRN